MFAIVKKHRIVIGLAVVALAFYLWQRSKKKTAAAAAGAVTGRVDDPSSDPALAKLFAQMNPGLA